MQIKSQIIIMVPAAILPAHPRITTGNASLQFLFCIVAMARTVYIAGGRHAYIRWCAGIVFIGELERDRQAFAHFMDEKHEYEVIGDGQDCT